MIFSKKHNKRIKKSIIFTLHFINQKTSTMKTKSKIMVVLTIFSLTIFSTTVFSQITMDTVSFPFPLDNDDIEVLSFYQKYSNQQQIIGKLTICSSPNSIGSDWYTKTSEGSFLNNGTTFNGTFQSRGSQKKVNLKNKNKKKYSTNSSGKNKIATTMSNLIIELDTTNGDLSLNENGNLTIYKTEIRNNIIYGFNNSNKIIVLTLENAN